MGTAWEEIKKLHKTSTAGAKEGIAFRYFSRPVASFVLYHIKDGRITPNQVTILSLLVGLAGSFVHALDLTWRGLIIGGVLFMMAHMLDALDGQLARLRKAGSVIGMYFDFFIDELKAYAVFVAIGVRLFRLALAGDAPRTLRWALETLHLDALGAAGVVVVGLVGLWGLAVGISSTEFIKRKEWKEAFVPALAPGATPAPRSPIQALVGVIEKFGKLVIDYPSYILLLCIANVVEVYFLLYALIVCLYAGRTLLGICLKLWRVNPYAKKPDAAA